MMNNTIIERLKPKNITPPGLMEHLAPDFYNLTIPVGIKTKILRMADEIVVNNIETKNSL